MKQCTTPKNLTRTLHQLEHILAEKDFPANCAAEVVAKTLLDLVPLLPEQEQQQIREIVCLYEACAERQYGPLYQRNHTRKG